MKPAKSSQPIPQQIRESEPTACESRPRERGSTWASFFVSVILHVNLLLILAVTLRALEAPDEPPLMIDTTFTPGEEAEITISADSQDDVVPVDDVVFTDAAPLTAEQMVKTDLKLDLPGLKGLGGAMGIGGGSGAGGVGFFGTTARGRSFVFVVDCSGSMGGNRFRRAVSELRKSLDQLEPDQTFQIVFFNTQAIPFSHSKHRTKLVPATKSVRQEASVWIGGLPAGGGTIPDDALRQALSLKPDVVFFLTDAESVPRTVRTLIADRNKHGSKVHTIAFGHRGGETLMQGIAADHHGRYRFVP